VDIALVIEECHWIETALTDPHSVEHRIYLSDAPRKDLITRWASNLEILSNAGEFHQDVNTISGYIQTKFRTWGMERAQHYVSAVLDFKYKDVSHTINAYREDPSSYENRTDSSNLLSFEAKQTNTLLISFMLHTINALKSNIDRLRKDVILESKLPEKEQELMFLNWQHILKRHQEAWDGREKVLSTQQHIMAYCLSGFSLNHAYIEYVRYAKEDTKLTEKQASKMARLQTNKIDHLFEPKNFMEAKELGFYGQRCGKCGSFRTEKRWNTDKSKDLLYCFDIHDDKNKDQWDILKTMKLEQVVI